MLRCITLALLAMAVCIANCQRFVAVPAVNSFPDNINLATLSPNTVDHVLRDRGAVLRLVSCFENIRTCQSAGAHSFVTQVRRLGPRGRCYRCSSREQAHIRNVMRRTVTKMQRSYPREWNRLVPILRHVL